MKRPDNIHDALKHMHYLLGAAGRDLEAYLDNPANHTPEYFESIKDCVLSAHMLVTWARDNTAVQGEERPVYDELYVDEEDE